MSAPLRMCWCCRQMKPKTDLLRVVKNKNGVIALDPTGKADGRGCYVCRQPECIAKGIKTRFANRALKCNVPQEVYDRLSEYVAR